MFPHMLLSPLPLTTSTSQRSVSRKELLEISTSEVLKLPCALPPVDFGLVIQAGSLRQKPRNVEGT